MNGSHFENLLAINDTLNRVTHEHYRSRGLRYTDVPHIVGITGACENIDTLFRVKG